MSTLDQLDSGPTAARPFAPVGGYGPPTDQQWQAQRAALQYPPVCHGPPSGYGQPGGSGSAPRPLGLIGTVRSTWAVIGLSLITLGIHALYYYFVTHEEMKRHSGEGVGGVVGLVLAVFFGCVTPFVLPHEVGNLYVRQGRAAPVSAATGLWAVLGWIILVGPLVWLIKINGALNAYWRSMGAR